MSLQQKKDYITKWVFLNRRNNVSQSEIAINVGCSQPILSLIQNQKYPATKMYEKVYRKIKTLQKEKVKPFLYFDEEELFDESFVNDDFVDLIKKINEEVQEIKKAQIILANDYDIQSLQEAVSNHERLLSDKIEKKPVGMIRKLWRWLY